MHPKLVHIAAVVVPVALGAESTFRSPSRRAIVTPLRIDAVVTDPQGHAIIGLRASDFEVREDGVSRRVSAAEFRSVPRHGADEVLPINTRLDEERAAHQPGTRVFAFFLDDFHVSPGASADRTRAAVASFLDEKVHERDLAAVIRPLDTVASIRFTRDRSVLHGSIRGFAGRKGDYTPRTPLEERLIGHEPATVRATRERIVRTSLRDLGTRLGELNADRAVIVLVSEGFPLDSRVPEGRLSDLWSLVRASSQFHFPIYTFDPLGGDEEGAPDGERAQRDSETLQWLAAETGGSFVRADAFIAGFARVFHDTLSYYALTYQPAHADGRFHRLELRTRRTATVRTHAHYWAEARNDANVSRSSSVILDAGAGRLLRRSALIDTWIGMRRDAAGGTRLVITWEPRKGHTRLPRAAVIKARTVTGTALFEGTIEPVRGVPGSATDSARFDVPAGRVEVDITLVSVDGTVLDTEARDFDVPDLRHSSKLRPVLLPTEIVRARTRRELQAASVNSDATPSSSRIFARGDQLLIRSWAFDPTGGTAQLSARVLSRAGQSMREIEATQRAPVDGVTQFILPLYWLAPGPYQLELSGTNANGTAKDRLAFQVE
jgi:VWFA-related protein